MSDEGIPAIPSSSSTPMETEPTAPRAPKRTASATGDLTQPADKKSKTTTSRRAAHSSEPGGGSFSTPGGIMNLLVNRFSSPFPCADHVSIKIDTNGFEGWFKTIRISLLAAIYPDQRYEDENVISEDNFVLVCRYLTKSRIDHVYASFTGRRPASRIAIPRDLEIPKCLADVINGIGSITVQGGGIVCSPEPEDAPADATQALTAVVSFETLSRFSRLTMAAKVRGLIRTGFITASIEGTAWWLLTARQPSAPDRNAVNANAVLVQSVFKEWTPADGMMCAIVQRNYNGIIETDAKLKWAMDFIPGVTGIRCSYNLEA